MFGRLVNKDNKEHRWRRIQQGCWEGQRHGCGSARQEEKKSEFVETAGTILLEMKDEMRLK